MHLYNRHLNIDSDSIKKCNLSHPKYRGGIKVNKNDGKDMRKNAPKQSGQQEPLSGSHKVKNRNHSRQKHNSHHDM